MHSFYRIVDEAFRFENIQSKLPQTPPFWMLLMGVARFSVIFLSLPYSSFSTPF